MGCFSLWIYVRYDPAQTATMDYGNYVEKQIASAAT